MFTAAEVTIPHNIQELAVEGTTSSSQLQTMTSYIEAFRVALSKVISPSHHEEEIEDEELVDEEIAINQSTKLSTQIA